MFDFIVMIFFFFKQKTAYEMRISDWSSDVCSSDLPGEIGDILAHRQIGVDEGAGRSLITRILSTETLRLRLEARGVLLRPPIAHRAAGVDLAPLIVEPVADLVPDHRTDRAIVDGIVHPFAEEGRLQYAGREHDLVFEPAVKIGRAHV